MTRKLVQFGAGNIGRSFIGQVFARGGYEVVFVDIQEPLVRALNEKRQYRVIIKRNDLPDEEMLIDNVRAVDGRDKDRVAEEIADASYVSTSVGKGALAHILPVLATGIVKREAVHPGTPLDIIIAENIRNGSEFFHKELSHLLPKGFDLERLIGLVETSIGKMVPIMKEEDIRKDPLWVFAEPYNTLILDRKGFKNPVPAIHGIHAVENIAAYVDRKLFIHNLGHAATAYFGYVHNPKFVYLYEALAVPALHSRVRTAMMQAAIALNKEYPTDLRLESLIEHIDDLLLRFQNKSLGDTIFRVGRDLLRKLDKEDRLVGAVLLALKHSCACDAIAAAAAAACEFRACDEQGAMYPEDREFADKIYPRGVAYILENVCKLTKDNPLEVRAAEEIARVFGTVQRGGFSGTSSSS